MSNQSIMCILINLVVLCLVWGTVLAGLILVVRDKLEDDDLAEYR
jgi:Na+-transporting NADH:ubiquinone oxidoreductase subunit NqrC